VDRSAGIEAILGPTRTVWIAREGTSKKRKKTLKKAPVTKKAGRNRASGMKNCASLRLVVAVHVRRASDRSTPFTGILGQHATVVVDILPANSEPFLTLHHLRSLHTYAQIVKMLRIIVYCELCLNVAP